MTEILSTGTKAGTVCFACLGWVQLGAAQGAVGRVPHWETVERGKLAGGRGKPRPPLAGSELQQPGPSELLRFLG